MTFADWLAYACKHRTTDYRRLLPELRFADGLELSVQASEHHLCIPNETLDDGDYYSVEVYTHGEKVKELDEYKIDKYTYGYVHLDVMDELAEKHGGIIIIEANDGISYLGSTIKSWANGNEPGSKSIKDKYFSDNDKCEIKDNQRYYLVAVKKDTNNIEYSLARDRS